MALAFILTKLKRNIHLDIFEGISVHLTVKHLRLGLERYIIQTTNVSLYLKKKNRSVFFSIRNFNNNITGMNKLICLIHQNE